MHGLDLCTNPSQVTLTLSLLGATEKGVGMVTRVPHIVLGTVLCTLIAIPAAFGVSGGDGTTTSGMSATHGPQPQHIVGCNWYFDPVPTPAGKVAVSGTISCTSVIAQERINVCAPYHGNPPRTGELVRGACTRWASGTPYVHRGFYADCVPGHSMRGSLSYYVMEDGDERQGTISSVNYVDC